MGIERMHYEILDAVHMMYEDEPEVEALCYVYLADLGDKRLAKLARDYLEYMNRCPNCGTPMQKHEYQEYHSDVGEYENFVIPYCPECDLNWRGEIDV